MKLIRGRKIREFSAAIMAVAIFAASAIFVSAQSTQAEAAAAKELKEKVQNLEATVTQLKEELDALKEAKANPKPAILDAKYTTGGAVAAGDKVPSTTADPMPASVPGQPTAKADDAASTFEIYGFAMLDAGYQFKSNHPDWFDVIRPTKLPSFEGEFDPDGKTYMGVRQSRLGVKSSIPTKWGDLKTIFEFELFGTGVDAGQTTFRLRHAYGELGQFGAGQYWTVFGDTDAYPNSMEYWGPNGLVWFRNVQVRWMPLKGRNSVTIGLERPGASGDQGIYSDRVELQGIRTQLRFPDLTGHVRWDRDWGHIQISGILRSIKWVDTNKDDGVDLSGSTVGGGGSFSSHFNFGSKDVGRFQFTYGAGIENYMNDAPVDIGVRHSVQINPLPSLQANGQSIGEIPDVPLEGAALPVFGMSTFLDHRWSEKFTTSVGYSMLDIQNSNAQSPSAFHRGHYGLANLLYYPVPNLMIGGEFQWGRRENFSDGFNADDFRIQFGFKYNFSKMVKF